MKARRIGACAGIALPAAAGGMWMLLRPAREAVERPGINAGPVGTQELAAPPAATQDRVGGSATQLPLPLPLPEAFSLSRFEDLVLDRNPDFGTPHFLRRLAGFLSPPAPGAEPEAILEAFIDGGTLRGTNSIVYFNQSDDGNDVTADTVVTDYSCVPANVVVGAHSTTNDPDFVSLSAGNCRLQTNSPCVNAGTNLPWMATAVDLDGHPRIYNEGSGGIVDMGAYERQSD